MEPERQEVVVESFVRTEVHGDVLLVVLDRPEKRNAFHTEMNGEFGAALFAGQQHGCIVITGAGPGFCSGLDLRFDPADLPNSGYEVGWAQMRTSRVPIIAAVNGPAVVGGLAIVANADFAVASDHASFRDTELQVIGYGNAELMSALQRRVGSAWARQMTLTGMTVDAATALRIGLVNEIVPHDELVERALELAAAIAVHDRAAVSVMRREWDAVEGLSPTAALWMHEDYLRPFAHAPAAFQDESRVQGLLGRS